MRCSITIQDSLFVLFFTLLFGTTLGEYSYGQPHIIVLMIDDLGWYDVGFHGSDQILTPNIDALAYNGIILNRHYVLPTGTQSRTAFFTGKYPMRFGLQEKELPPNVKMLPYYLQDIGYTTRLVGKWRYKNSNPLAHGFDKFYDDYKGNIDSYTYSYQNMSGYDTYRNAATNYNIAEKNSIDLSTDEAIRIIKNHKLQEQSLYLQISYRAVHSSIEIQGKEDTNLYNHIREPSRRKYAKRTMNTALSDSTLLGLISQLDDSVGNIVVALNYAGMLRDSLILFLTDNGAPSIGRSRNHGSNYPLRGTKYTLYEGGVRSLAFIWSPRFQDSARVSNDLIHITDWLPTIYFAAGGKVSDLEHIDGVNQWNALMDKKQPAVRRGLLLNIDEMSRTEGVIFDRFKLVRGSIEGGYYDGYSGKLEKGGSSFYNVSSYASNVTNSTVSRTITENLGGPVTQPSTIYQLRNEATVNCNDNSAYIRGYFSTCNVTDCLFDIIKDPCERRNLFVQHPKKTSELGSLLDQYACHTKEQLSYQIYWPADPSRQNHTWEPWICPDEILYLRSNAALISFTYCAHIGAILLLILSTVFILI